jgi:hypothetical protein
MNPADRKTWFRQIEFAAFFTGVGAILSLLVFYTWLRTYPDDVDPKNIDYVLWNHGLNNNMNLDSALAAMSHDVWPVRRVGGVDKGPTQGALWLHTDTGGSHAILPGVLFHSGKFHSGECRPR